MRFRKDIPDVARMVTYIPIDGYVEGHGWRVSFVVEGEAAHRPTGNWPYSGATGETMPWFWGHDYEKACELSRDYNKRMGIDEETALKIVARAMGDAYK